MSLRRLLMACACGALLALPVAAHAQTAEALEDVHVDRLIEDNDVITLEGEPVISLRALHTPGHAQGHLCFHDETRGVL